MALEDATNPMQGVSGPGSFAKRTDLQYQAPAYGDAQALQQQMAGAPLAKSPDPRGATNTAVRQAAAQAAPQAPVSLYAPTQRPQEPVTSGLDMGAGPGSDALMMRQPDDSEFRNAMKDYMPVIAYIASLPNTSPETRRAMRQLRDQL